MKPRFLTIIIILVAMWVPVIMYHWFCPPLPVVTYQRGLPSGVAPPPELQSLPALSELAEVPDWSELDAYQEVISRDDFVELLAQVYVVGDAWRDWMELTADEVRIETRDGETQVLRFAAPGYELTPRREWLRTEDLPPAPVGRPLHGLHIAIDPGHLGGEWARMEARWLVVGDHPPVCEGDMTLQVAQLLKPRLEGLGATVTLVREDSQPVTSERPEDFLGMAREQLGARASEEAVRQLAEKWFYRTAEIRARADKINDEIRPDLVLCLHFNADAWGDPENPTLVERHHFHVLVNGAYGAGEVALEDQRFLMLKRLLSRSHREEAAVAKSLADVFMEYTEMPPFRYPDGAANALNVDGHDCVWARNLLANRVYACPVVFPEPYVMNSVIDHPRMVAGDYLGLREVAGKLQPSIFREYTELVVAGLVRHYGQRR